MATSIISGNSQPVTRWKDFGLGGEEEGFGAAGEGLRERGGMGYNRFRLWARAGCLSFIYSGCAGAIDHAMPKRIDHQRLFLNSRRTYYISMDRHGQIDPAQIGPKNRRLWSK